MEAIEEYLSNVNSCNKNSCSLSHNLLSLSYVNLLAYLLTDGFVCLNDFCLDLTTFYEFEYNLNFKKPLYLNFVNFHFMKLTKTIKIKVYPTSINPIIRVTS
jgi:hypothetical protein